ncbi:CPL (NUC119) domain [Nesidiocoris tenuis]|uniref:CPL (NUC119) domain n=1 Tax=Nesidiocoris tenuis TaxID=355587 RepID=A0ABN7BD63_9HEMI|nr:CPL (NUC119) domain [Nesidiocoris tenuis]
MAATKRKSSEGLNVSPKKPAKINSKGTTTKVGGKKSDPSKKKAEGGKKEGKKSEKSLSITFPEDGKVEWNTIKKQSKDLTEKRKQKKFKNNFNLIQEAKKKFELFRNKKCQGSEREALVLECTKMLKGLLSEKARSHDVARLIQWLLKLGSPDVRRVVVDEIINDVCALARCKYANHIVKNIVVSCDSSIRRRIIAKLTEQVVKLLSSRLSAPILEDVYAKYANSAEKAAIRRELYGDLCKPMVPINREFKLPEILLENKSLAPTILTSVKSILGKLLEKQWLLGSAIVMSVLFDYLQACPDKDRLEMLEPLRGHVATISKTRVGAEVCLIILKNSSAKEKKEIIKDIKGDIGNIAVSPSGCLFLQHLIDSVDDTVLMKKALLPTVIENADELIGSESGRKLISYIVAHRDGHFFHPSDVNLLKSADDSAFVKKSAEIRMRELQEACVPALLSKIADNPKLWLNDGCTCLLTGSILQIGSGDKLDAAFRGIADFVTDPESRLKGRNPEEIAAIEDPAVNKTLKKIIKDDVKRSEKGEQTFSRILTSKLDDATVSWWANSNRGCFGLVFLLECELDDVVRDLKAKILSSKCSKQLKKSTFKGAQILLPLLT